jgi:integrase
VPEYLRDDEIFTGSPTDGKAASISNHRLALACAAFNLAVERRMLAHSPLDGVKLFNESKHRKPPRIISFTEEQKILMCCDVRLRLIVITLLDAGMRVGMEALRLKWADIDFEESIITVVQSKTVAGLRALPMTTFVKSELHKWYVATKGMSEYVFFNPQRPLTHIPLRENCLAQRSQDRRTASVPHLSMPGDFRDKTGRGRC